MTQIWNDLQHHICCVLNLNGVKGILATITAALFGNQWLPIHGAIIILFVTDWVLGFTIALIQRRISSAASMRGVAKGLLYAVIMLVAAQLGKVYLVGPWIGGVLLALIAITEAISVLEKADVVSVMFGVKVPFLRSVIKFLQQRSATVQKELE